MSTTLLYITLELKSRIRAYMVWVFWWAIMAVYMAYVFNMISDTASANSLLKTLDPNLLKAFNIGENYFTSVEGFVGGQFTSLYGLIGSIFALFVGVGCIGGEIEQKRIHFILLAPFSRTAVYLTRFVVNSIGLLVSTHMVFLLAYILFVHLTNIPNISYQFFISIASVLAIIQLCILSVAMVLGLIGQRQMVQSVSIGALVASWFMNSLSSLSGYPEWIRPFSVFYYANIPHIIETFNVDSQRSPFFIFGIIIPLAFGIYLFRKTDILC